ncbi:hypothetical protein A2U01_0053717, partial [Trifolium medium]|nr:hypothetical protein [Trifolium medium]
MVAVGVHFETSRCHGASDVFIRSRWPVSALLFSDLFLYFSALSVLAGRCASALLESALFVLALIFSLWDVLGSYPAK